MHRSRGTPQIALGVVAAVAVLVTAGRLSGLQSPAPVAVPPTARASAPTLPAAVSARLSLAGWPDRLAFDGTSIWATDYADALVVRIDPRIGRVVDQIPIGQRNRGPLSVAVAGDSAWAVTRGFLWRIDRRTDRIVGKIPLDGGDALAGDGRALWVTCCRYPAAGQATSAVRVDPATGRRQRTIPLPFVPGAVATDGRALWVAGSEPGRDVLWRIDAATGRTVAKLRLGTPSRPVAVRELAVTPTSVWALSADTDEGTVANSLVRVVAATNLVAATIELPGTPVGLAADAEAVWVTLLEESPQQDDVLRIDARTGKVTGGMHVASPGPVLLTAGGVWVGSRYLLLKVDPARLSA